MKLVAMRVYSVYLLRHHFIMLDEPDDLEVQLGTGNGSSSGLLYMRWSGRLQRVANSLSTWGLNNSDVVCRELGYAPYSPPSICCMCFAVHYMIAVYHLQALHGILLRTVHLPALQ